jgi:hypothetical protein
MGVVQRWTDERGSGFIDKLPRGRTCLSIRPTVSGFLGARARHAGHVSKIYYISTGKDGWPQAQQVTNMVAVACRSRVAMGHRSRVAMWQQGYGLRAAAGFRWRRSSCSRQRLLYALY